MLKVPYTDKHSMQAMIDELFDLPPSPQPSVHTTQKSMSAMIDELFDPPPPPQPSAPSTNSSMSAMIDDFPLPAKSHTTGNHESHLSVIQTSNHHCMYT